MGRPFPWEKNGNSHGEILEIPWEDLDPWNEGGNPLEEAGSPMGREVNIPMGSS
jgi:hypothetical protein